MIDPGDERFIPVEPGFIPPFACGNGWYRAKGYPATLICGDCTVSKDAFIAGYAKMFGGKLLGGVLKGAHITATCVEWVASVCSPGMVQVGCVGPFTFEEWLAPYDADGCVIPWLDEHCTEPEIKAAQQVIAAMQAQEALGLCWGEEA